MALVEVPRLRVAKELQSREAENQSQIAANKAVKA